MSVTIRIVFVTIMLLCSPWVYAFDNRVQIEMGPGINGDGRAHLQLSLQKSWSQRWVKLGYDIQPYGEATIGVWRGNDDAQIGDRTVYVGGVAAAAAVKRVAASDRFPWFDIGVGVRYLSNSIVVDRDVSTRFQFVEFVGVVWRFGERDRNEVGLRLHHVSNANIEHPNPGVDFLTLKYTYAF